MLKLEKEKKSSTITIRFREREPTFNRLLGKALLIALAIHLGALVLFHVSPFLIQTTFIHPPIQVLSDHSNASHAELDEEDFDETLYPPAPPLEFDLKYSQLVTMSDFIERETIFFSAPPQKEHMMITPIQMHISGELNQRRLVRYDEALDRKVALDQTKMDPDYVTYHVQVDELSGKIFWFERIRSSGSKETDQWTEKVLLDLEFETGNPFVNTSGTIDFTLIENLT